MSLKLNSEFSQMKQKWDRIFLFVDHKTYWKLYNLPCAISSLEMMKPFRKKKEKSKFVVEQPVYCKLYIKRDKLKRIIHLYFVYTHTHCSWKCRETV